MGTLLKAIRGGDGAGEVDVKADRAGNLHIAEMLPGGALLTGEGSSYTAITTTAVAALVDEPTNAALFTLYNGEAAGGLCYIIERVFAFMDISSAAAARWSLWAIVQPVGTTAVAQDITLINNIRGVDNYGGNARLGVGDAVVNNGWSPWSSSQESVELDSLSGPAVSVDVAGRMVIPPTAAVSLHVVSSSVDEDFNVGFQWSEVRLDLG